ncbi:MAG: hypothetical protein NDI61_07535 [Bdellovibrionaceae bacterium]|nr:hypothetical protein [Pseudobdellovibrionaceae bacterium]
MKTSTEWKKWLDELESRLRAGQLHWVRKELTRVKRKQIPRAFAATMATLARRANLPMESLNILNGIMRSPWPMDPPPRPDEISSYAATLFRIGAIDEGMALLRTVDTDAYPQALLFEALAHFSQWRYDSAIPVLKKYVHSPLINDYQRLVGKTNLAAAYITERNFPAGRSLVSELKDVTAAQNLHILHGNALELSAQLSIFQGHLDQARRDLEEASKFLSQTQGAYELFVDKWSCIVNLLSGAISEKIILQLAHVKRVAMQLREWETLRECDLYLAVATNDEDLYEYLAFGTPYEKYRARMREIFQPKRELPETYLWTPRPVPNPDESLGNGGPGSFMNTASEVRSTPVPSLKIDIDQGRVGDSQLPHGQLLHRALALFSTDFYKPFRIGQLYSHLFPNEYFNPVSSPRRIVHIVERLRAWFKDNALPLNVRVRGGNYSLIGDTSATCGLLVSQTSSHAHLPKSSANLERLKSQWPHHSFSTSQASRCLNLSLASTRRLLAQAVNDGKLLRQGNGRGTFYRFTAAKSRALAKAS